MKQLYGEALRMVEHAADKILTNKIELTLLTVNTGGDTLIDLIAEYFTSLDPDLVPAIGHEIIEQFQQAAEVRARAVCGECALEALCTTSSVRNN